MEFKVALKSHVGPKVRKYCWRTGIGVYLADGEKCPECGATNHRIIEPGTCGNYVQVDEETGRGLPCILSPGHEGKCQHG